MNDNVVKQFEDTDGIVEQIAVELADMAWQEVEFMQANGIDKILAADFVVWAVSRAHLKLRNRAKELLDGA